MSNANDSARPRPDAMGENGQIPGIAHVTELSGTGSRTSPRDTQTMHGGNTAGGKWHGAIGATARWGLAVLACLWLAWCTAIGPLYWQFDLNPKAATLGAFSWINGLIGVLTFAAYLIIIIELVRYARGLRLVPRRVGWWFQRASIRLHHGKRGSRPVAVSVTEDADHDGAASAHATDGEDDGGDTVRGDDESTDSAADHHCQTQAKSRKAGKGRFRRFARKAVALCRRWLMRGTDRWQRIALVLLIGWLWVPTTLVTAFGADLRSQFREFSWALNQWTGLREPYIGFFSFVPMDIYPTAHYLWPANPTYLTDQHNIVLTMVYGSVAALSRFFTGSNDWGIAALSFAQFLFAVFCVAVTADRFLNRPWLAHVRNGANGKDDRNKHDGADATSVKGTDGDKLVGALPIIGPLVRLAIMAFFLFCPLAVFSTISLTKSPLFAFAFIWWFGVVYELLMTRGMRIERPHHDGKSGESGKSDRKRLTGAPLLGQIRGHSLAALAVSTVVMLISAKYAWYILVVEIVLLLVSDRKRWKTYAVGILLPLVVVHGGLSLLIANGTIIGGDPIESHGVQLQQIARVARLEPKTIPQSARDELAPIFNLDQMAEAYKQQDADPVKSSGIQSKKVSYRWRTVTAADMANLNKAWLQIVKANPRVSLDALMAKSYGYFDIADGPYIDMTYYASNEYVRTTTAWIGSWCAPWRGAITQFAKQWSHIPVLGWIIHGNTYVIATLLIGAAEVIQRRWRTLVTHIPLLLLMGVMITSPANNFERHMLPLAFLLGFVAITFWQDSLADRRAGMRPGNNRRNPREANAPRTRMKA
ncbi:DUF6020 family protein [Bifidobacterium sp. ESL0763]|uniref:DUF6020 family protein n=1 Tax=Bifidobacterium sp. ESL0763 TaxID=2983227 RepID=UPI0023F6D56D|nr:DUF6020 family protein [Bifidobacterium sp. ESL0763]MDF7663353.1 DUF6020 family protein [Bifidobacterium sp. ESL0763]